MHVFKHACTLTQVNAGAQVHAEDVRRNGSGQRFVQVVEAASAVGHMLHGKSLENVAAGIDCHTVKQPLGVVAGICPFNFPAMVMFSHILSTQV